jgi:hypothetical protein
MTQSLIKIILLIEFVTQLYLGETGMSCRKRIDLEGVETDPRKEVQSLIDQSDDIARLLECHYWSMEPGLLETIRALLATPIEARAALQAFFALAIVPDSITASVDADGTLNLRSPEAAEALITFFSSTSGSA